MKKFNKGYIGYTAVTAVFGALFAVIFLFDLVVGEEVESLAMVEPIRWVVLAGIGGLVYLFQVVSAALYVYTSGYELADGELRCHHGVLVKKNSVVSFQKIHAVNKKQNLLQRLLGIAVLTVDSGATGNLAEAEITVIEKSATVDRLMEQIKRVQEGEPPVSVTANPASPDGRQNRYVFSSKLKTVYALLTLVGSLATVLVLVVMAVAVIAVLAAVLPRIPQDDGMTVAELWILLAFLSVGAAVLVSLMGLIGGMLYSFVGYHDFRLYKNRNDVEISYGLLVRHTNTFKFRRIKAVKITEGPVKRLFGYASAGLEVVGYGSENSGEGSEQNRTTVPGMLFPLCKAKDVKDVLQDLLPGYAPAEITHKAKAYAPFVLWPLFYTAVVFALLTVSALCVLWLTGSVTDVYWWVLGILAAAAFVTVLAVLISGLLRRHNAGIGFGEKSLTLCSGGLVRQRTVIGYKDLVAVERVTTPLRQKKGICSYTLHFFANALTNTVTVENLDADLGDRLENLLRD